jgi:fatty acid-binding protein DegV
VALGLNTANIVAYLDWRSNAIPTMTTQGNVIVMGQSETSCTTINHSYSNNQPELEINRVDGNDTETIKIGEGFIILQTAEVSASGNESILAAIESLIDQQVGGSSSS